MVVLCAPKKKGTPQPADGHRVLLLGTQFAPILLMAMCSCQFQCRYAACRLLVELEASLILAVACNRRSSTSFSWCMCFQTGFPQPVPFNQQPTGNSQQQQQTASNFTYFNYWRNLNCVSYRLLYIVLVIVMGRLGSQPVASSVFASL